MHIHMRAGFDGQDSVPARLFWPLKWAQEWRRFLFKPPGVLKDWDVAQSGDLG